MYGQKKNFSTFSYKLVQISPIMILVNSGAFLSISSWLCELTELIFVMIPYISSSGYPPKRKGLWICASSEYNSAQYGPITENEVEHRFDREIPLSQKSLPAILLRSFLRNLIILF